MQAAVGPAPGRRAGGRSAGSTGRGSRPAPCVGGSVRPAVSSPPRPGARRRHARALSARDHGVQGGLLAHRAAAGPRRLPGDCGRPGRAVPVVGGRSGAGRPPGSRAACARRRGGAGCRRPGPRGGLLVRGDRRRSLLVRRPEPVRSLTPLSTPPRPGNSLAAMRVVGPLARVTGPRTTAAIMLWGVRWNLNGVPSNRYHFVRHRLRYTRAGSVADAMDVMMHVPDVEGARRGAGARRRRPGRSVAQVAACRVRSSHPGPGAGALGRALTAGDDAGRAGDGSPRLPRADPAAHGDLTAAPRLADAEGGSPPAGHLPVTTPSRQS